MTGISSVAGPRHPAGLDRPRLGSGVRASAAGPRPGNRGRRTRGRAVARPIRRRARALGTRHVPHRTGVAEERGGVAGTAALAGAGDDRPSHVSRFRRPARRRHARAHPRPACGWRRHPPGVRAAVDPRDVADPADAAGRDGRCDVGRVRRRVARRFRCRRRSPEELRGHRRVRGGGVHGLHDRSRRSRGRTRRHGDAAARSSRPSTRCRGTRSKTAGPMRITGTPGGRSRWTGSRSRSIARRSRARP